MSLGSSGLGSSPISIAVNGGGFAGAIMARSLLKYPQFNVHIYESASTFQERGAAVGLANNALQALEMIDPKLRQTLDDAGGVPSHATKSIIGEGPKMGETVIDIAALTGSNSNPSEIIVHRARFLEELLKYMPPSVMHVNKKLIHIDELKPANDGSLPRLILKFSDGSSDQVHAIIGADGIHGYVRRFVLGDDNPLTMPVYAGWWDTRNLVSVEQGTKAIVSKFVEPQYPRQHAWIGNGGFLMHDIIDNGEVLQCVAAVRNERNWDPRKWKRTLTKDELLEKFGDWLIGKPMADLLNEQQDLTAFSQWHHEGTPTFFKDNICIMGDAAHAITPWQGSGAGQAIEDTVILQSLLGRVETPSEISRAFQAYDTIRRPRAMEIVDSSYQTGLIFTGQNESIGLDPEKLREALAPRWDFIFNVDLGAMKKQAIRHFERPSKRLKSQGV